MNRDALYMASAGFEAGGVVGALLRHDLLSAAIFAASLIVVLLAWRRSRRNRKRIAGALGAKSRAIRDALVRKAREAARPRRVLKPVPGGAA